MTEDLSPTGMRFVVTAGQGSGPFWTVREREARRGRLRGIALTSVRSIRERPRGRRSLHAKATTKDFNEAHSSPHDEMTSGAQDAKEQAAHAGALSQTRSL